MNPSMVYGLLPEGLRDGLFPEAEAEALLLRSFLDLLIFEGYARVSPPLVDYEANLVLGAKPDDTAMWRLLDPLERRPLVVRADITPQIARIALTRLRSMPRPLRLCYAGPVLRPFGSMRDPSRQFMQLGAELIGSATPEAAQEIITLAVLSLRTMGLKAITLDVVMPDLVPELSDLLGLNAHEAHAVHEALNTKDEAVLQDLPYGSVFAALLTCTGDIDQAIARLETLDLPEPVKRKIDKVIALRMGLSSIDVPISFDPSDRRGFAYHGWLGFSLFAEDVPDEVVRGGTYDIEDHEGCQEQCTGFTLYLDGLLHKGQGVKARKRLYVPYGIDAPHIALGRQEWMLVRGLAKENDVEVDAIAQGCGQWWDGEKIRVLMGNEGSR